jgi:asparagine synthase (glutamine-hydrolysing)
MLPAEIVDRPKAGFRVPIAAWLRGSMRDMAHDRLLGSDSFVGEVFDRQVIESLLASHGTGERNEDIRIWTLLSLEVWHERFRAQLAPEVSPHRGPTEVRPG